MSIPAVLKTQLKPLGDQLVVSGNQQIATARRLKDASSRVRAAGEHLKSGEKIDKSLDSVRAGTQAIHRLMGPIVTALRFVVNALNAVTVPTVSAQTRTVSFPVVGNVTFVTGITIGSARPLQAVATRIDDIRNNVVDIREMIASIRDATVDLRKELPKIRADMSKGADFVADAGEGVRESGATMVKAGKLIGGA